MDACDLTWRGWWSKIMSFVDQQKGQLGMKVFAVAVALSMMLAAAPIHAQAPAQTRPAPAGQGQARPAAPAGQTPPAAPRPAVPAPAPPAPAVAQTPHPPFPAGVKYAFVYVQRIASESAEGKAATAKINALQQQKVNELNDKNKALQAAQQKLDSGGSVINDAARTQLTNDIDRQQRDIQRFTEDAQQDVQKMTQELQDEFQKKLTPVIGKVAQEKQLHMIFSVTDSGLVWGDPALDLTEDVIKEFDAANKK
jgi:Skp family chaperone for outer membrane proteins